MPLEAFGKLVGKIASVPKDASDLDSTKRKKPKPRKTTQ